LNFHISDFHIIDFHVSPAENKRGLSQPRDKLGDSAAGKGSQIYHIRSENQGD